MHLRYVDDNLLRTPPVAVEMTKREIIAMSELAMDNFDRALSIVTSLDLSELDLFNRNEEQLNFINRSLVNFVVRLSEKKGLSEKDHVYLTTTFRTVRDLERIGDYAENIIEYAENLKESNQHFSDDALYEISQLKILVHNLYDKVMLAYNEESFLALGDANSIEDQIDDYTKVMEDNHILRLSKGICTPNTGAQYLSLSTNVERIGDHLINVAKTIRSFAKM